MSASMRRFGNFTVAALLAAGALTMFSPSQATAETRSLKLYYVHTGEKAEITFKKNGRYLSDGLKRLNVFLRDWRRNEPTKMDPRLFDLIWQVYRATGSNQYITVVSAYRSPATNNMLRARSSGVAKKSQHTLGRAMDFFIPGVPLAKLRSIAMRYQLGGVGYYPRSGSPFVHLDVGNVRSWPRMSRRELLALFPDGKTVHLPSDGKPLPGYQQALAMLEKRKASGGEIMIASSSSSSPKKKTLLGAIFGGGADEEEDNNDSARPARAAPARRAPTVAPAQPVQQQPETLIAALPARDVPRPVAAPRPDAVVEQAPAEVEAPVVALNIPVPALKPAIAAQDPVALTIAGQLADSTVAAVDNDADMIQQVADASTSTLLTGYVPVPGTRPHAQADLIQLASVAVPAARPEIDDQPAAQDAIAEIVNNAAEDMAVLADAGAPAPMSAEDALKHPLPQPAPRRDTQLAMVSPKDEIGELIGPPEDDFEDETVAVAKKPEPAKPLAERIAPVQTASMAPIARKVSEQTAAVGEKIDTGVRTTAKGARYAAKSSSRPKPIVQPPLLPTPDVVMAQSMMQRAPETSPHLRNDALRSAPTMVYTTGFQRGELPRQRVHQFSGNAVTFLAVARFSETN